MFASCFAVGSAAGSASAGVANSAPGYYTVNGHQYVNSAQVSTTTGQARALTQTKWSSGTTPSGWAGSNGLTYGSAADSDKPENEPDLIRVVATNGKEGYVKKAELEDADGTTAARSFKNPEDAVAWQNSEGLKDRTVAVYASDGETVIGEFLVVGTATQQKSLSSTDLPLD